MSAHLFVPLSPLAVDPAISGDHQSGGHSGRTAGGLPEEPKRQHCLSEGPAGQPGVCQTRPPARAGTAGLSREGEAPSLCPLRTRIR